MKRIVSCLLMLSLFLFPTIFVSAAEPREFVGIIVKGPNEDEMNFAAGLYRTLYTGNPIHPELTVYACYEYSDGTTTREIADEQHYSIAWEDECVDVGVHHVYIRYNDSQGNTDTLMAGFYIIPHTPKEIRYTFDWPNLILSWDASAGATGYRVKRFDEERQMYVEMLRRENDPDSIEDSSTTQVIKGLEKGKTYWFAVQPTPCMMATTEIVEIRIDVPLDPPSLVTTTSTATVKPITTTTSTLMTPVTTTTTAVADTTTAVAISDENGAITTTTTDTTTNIVTGDREPLKEPDYGGWIVVGIVLGVLLIGGGITSWVLIKKK